MSSDYEGLNKVKPALELLNDAVEVINSASGLNEIYEKVLDSIIRIDNLDKTAIFLVDEKKGEAVLQAERNLPELFIQRARNIPHPQGIVWKLINQGRILHIKDVGNDPDSSPADRMIGNRALLGIPVLLKGKSAGTVCFLSSGEDGFDESEMTLLTLLGSNIAMAISKIMMSEERQKMKSAIDQASDLVLISGKDEKIEYVNTAFLNLTGYTREEVVGNTPSILKSGKLDRNFYNSLRKTISSGMTFSGEFINRKKDGSLYCESKTISPVRNGNGDITHFISAGRDITEHKHLKEQLTELANRDYLTGVLNRYSFEKEIERRLADSNGGAFILFDLDNFKIVNDNYGYQFGDKILIKFSKLISEGLREGDTIARVGGDEFAVFLSGADSDQARTVANRMIDSVYSHTFKQKDESVRASISVGISIFPEHGVTLEDLFSYADKALSESKEKGGNCLSIYAQNELIQSRIISRRYWIRRVIEALEKDLFLIYAQPVFNIRDISISHYELLLRMRNANGEIIQPGSFLDVSERSGLIRSIDHWVVRHAIGVLKKLLDKQTSLKFSINISNQSFVDDELLELIRHELGSSSIDPACLQFEITETGIIASIEKASQFVNELRNLGCSFALDDFGKGYSSMYHLKHLPVDYLKIDGEFIRKLNDEPIDRHIVRSAVQLASGFNMKLIAEHLENEETLAILREYGIEYVQGNYLARPFPLDEIL